MWNSQFYFIKTKQKTSKYTTLEVPDATHEHIRVQYVRSAQHDMHGPLCIPVTNHMRFLVRRPAHIEHDHHIRRAGGADALEGIILLRQPPLLNLRQHVLQQRLVLRVNAVGPADRLRQPGHQPAEPRRPEQVARALVGRREPTLGFPRGSDFMKGETMAIWSSLMPRSRSAERTEASLLPCFCS